MSVLVPVTVYFTGGTSVQFWLEQTDTIATLKEKVVRERQLTWLQDVDLFCVGDQERLSKDVEIVQLVKHHGGHAVCLQAVVLPAVETAMQAVRSAEFNDFCNNKFSMKYLTEFFNGIPHERSLIPARLEDGTAFKDIARNIRIQNQERTHDLEKYLAVLELLIANHCNVLEIMPEWCVYLRVDRDPTPDEGRFLACYHFLVTTRVVTGTRYLDHPATLFWTWFFSTMVHPEWEDGTRPMVNGTESRLLSVNMGHHDIFNDVIIAAISDPSAREAITEGYSQVHVRATLADDVTWQLAFEWLVQEHPQESVRNAASEALVNELPKPTPPRASRAAGNTSDALGTEGPAVEPMHPSDELMLEDIDRALRLSNEDAVQREGQEVAEALMRSKADMPKTNMPKFLVATLTFHTPEVVELLLGSDALASSRDRVLEAGCELTPAWAGGSLLLVPTTESHFLQHVACEGLRPKAHHIFMFAEDRALVEQALWELPRRRRPILRAPCRSDAGEADTSAPSLGGPEQDAPDEHWMSEVGIVVVKTFVHFPVANDASEATVVVESAPACPGQEAMRPNPHRWRLGRGPQD